MKSNVSHDGFFPVGIAHNGPICGFIQVLDRFVLNCVASVYDGLEVKLPEHATTLRQVQDHAPAIARLLLSMPEARLHPVLQALVKEVRLLCDCVNAPKGFLSIIEPCCRSRGLDQMLSACTHGRISSVPVNFFVLFVFCSVVLL